jgi:hypothetical protein
METSGRGRSEKAMIIIPAGVLLWAIVVVAGGPSQFIRVLNGELRNVSTMITGWVGAWF